MPINTQPRATLRNRAHILVQFDAKSFVRTSDPCYWCRSSNNVAAVGLQPAVSAPISVCGVYSFRHHRGVSFSRTSCVRTAPLQSSKVLTAMLGEGLRNSAKASEWEGSRDHFQVQGQHIRGLQRIQIGDEVSHSIQCCFGPTGKLTFWHCSLQGCGVGVGFGVTQHKRGPEKHVHGSLCLSLSRAAMLQVSWRCATSVLRRTHP